MKGEIHCKNCSSFGPMCDYCLLEEKWAKKFGHDTCAPGSPGALSQGCKCPIVDNGNGSGSYKGEYIVNTDCVMHSDGRIALEEVHECPECNYIQWFVGTAYGDAVRVCANEECRYWEDI